MDKLKTIFHPIFIFIGVQIAWIILMAIWINWYVKNRHDIEQFPINIPPELSNLFDADLNWVILLEGCFLMMVILAGVYLIFVYWNKQARLNRMQSNFISSVSHELKSPLASIQLYLETMKYHDVSKEEARDFVETMLTDTERLSSLIDNILEAGSTEPKSMQLQFQPVEMKAFLSELLEGYQLQFKEKEFDARLEIKDAPTLNLDKRAIRMVFNNLIGNALRYSSPGVPFTIRMRNQGKYCEIEFVDSGIGLSQKDLKSIFRKFYRVQNRETQNIEGAGLGLFISREILKNHKGKIQVFSEGKGKGSTFKVLLPLNGAATESMSRTA